jgi:FemAB-related protein (PEP-CTERM system-associated)
MRVRLISDADLPVWQEFVDENADAGCMHHAGWYGVLRDAFWVSPYFLMATNEQGRVEGILPAYLSSSPFSGRHISSLEDGVLATSAEATSALLAEARSLRDKTSSRYLQIRGGAIDRPAEIMQPAIHTCLDTSEPIETLWAAIRKKTRWAIRQAAPEGVQIEHDSALARLGDFYAAYAAHMRDLGTPVFGADVFAAIVRHLGPDRLRLYIASDRRALIGGMLCFINGRRWTNYYAIVRPSLDTEFANYLLYWHVIRDAARTGVICLDLGRSTPGSNVHLFKRKWRGTDIDVPYHFYLGPNVRADNLGFSKEKREKGMLQKCWSTLPLFVTNRLGPLIRRQLPFI